MQELEKILEEIDGMIESYKENPRLEIVDICYGLNQAKRIIHKHMNDGWIPVENPPEDGQTVLCTDGEYVYLVEYDADLDAPFGDMDGIIAWQPLPEPYRPERSDNHDRE